MSNVLPPKPPSGTADPRAKTGLVIAAMGLGGWLLTLAIILSVPKEQYTDDGQRNLLVGMSNGLSYLWQVAVGIVGLSVNGTLSLVGTLVSVSGSGHEDAKPTARWGIGLGVAGMLIGIALVVWRLAAWGLL
jgi:hypothetical protein